MNSGGSVGAHRMRRGYLAVLLFLAALLIVDYPSAHGHSIGKGFCYFKEAGISVQHARSLPVNQGIDTREGDIQSGCGGVFSDCGVILGPGVNAGSLAFTGDSVLQIESNMSEEVVAGTPLDLDEEEDIPLPVDLNKRVEYAITHFRTGARAHFETWQTRSGKYEGLIRKILRSEGVPGDFVYLAMIESGFSTKAVSRAGAVGIWQFMYWTGKKYGLNINWWDDERRDFEHSTRAAARYLKDLYGMFGSWYLAAAAYNVGEGKIGRAIRRYRTKDYWKLVNYRYLPRETKNYVPKMLAALTIMKDPGNYGFEDNEVDEPLCFDVVDLPGGIDLRTVADIIGVDYDEIKRLNPGIRRGVSPPGFESYPVRVPPGMKERAENNVEVIQRKGEVTFLLHRVRSKDNIFGVAKKYSSDATRIREVNGLRGNRIGGRRRLIIPVLNKSENTSVASLEAASSGSLRKLVSSLERSARYYYVYREGNRKIYLVKRGDSLYKISRRFGVSISTLKRLNGLTGDIIRPGQKITVSTYGSAGKKRGSVYNYTIDGGKKVYRVEVGNTLYDIGNAFGISVDQIKKMNGIKGEIIRPGMKLIVGYTG